MVRNAGATAKDALRSIVISQQLLGTREILVIKHTGCGMLTFTNDVAAGLVEKNLGAQAKRELDAFGADFQAFPELEEAVRGDVQYLKASPLIADSVEISGWVYEVETGKTRRVV